MTFVSLQLLSLKVKSSFKGIFTPFLFLHLVRKKNWGAFFFSPQMLFPRDLLFTFGPLFSQEVEYETCVDWKKCDFLSQVFVLLSSSRRGAVVSVFLRSCYAFSFLYLLKDETQWIWNTVFFIVIMFWTFPNSLNLFSFLLNFSWRVILWGKKKRLLKCEFCVKCEY